ncbi:MAG: glycosyltransferase family 4 protein [Xanthobacteraceae bacterium]|jgi:glycosyltransferase involved in cell wall biosynthesis
MRDFVFAVPGDLATPTGGYVYDRRMIAELPRLGWQARILDLGGEFPRPSAIAHARAHARLISVPSDRPIVIDGLALGVMPYAVAGLHETHKVIALVHHPLALETGLSSAEAELFRATERAALAFVHHVIVTGKATARLLADDYAVPLERITVVQPGVDAAIRPRADRGDTVVLLSVGALVPRKGYDVLLAALAQVRDLSWRLTIVGARDRSPTTAAELDAAIAELDLADRVTLAGVVSSERLAALYTEADMFVLPSRFEGYGMAFAEALAHGVPVIGTIAGAIPETVPAGSGILVPPDDIPALATALRLLIADSAARLRLAAAARAAAAQLPTWPQSAKLFSRVLEAAA